MATIFENKIRALRKYQISKNTNCYIRCFSEKDVYRNEIVDAFALILKTKGCRWALEHGGCSMCGYINESAQTDVSDDDILIQFSEAMKRYRNEKIVKIFTSGSFFDCSEISKNVQKKILEFLSDKAEKVIVESRPEFIVKEHLVELKSVCNLEIALGLESANPLVLEKSIHKGFGVEDYTKAARIINELKIPLKTYILIKPPFLTEKEAIADAINSARFASKYSETISFNPVNIQKNTFVEYLWKRKEFFPPWLWSVVEVLRKVKVSSRLMCAPTAGGTKRGAHNCGKCDLELLKAIKEFSLTQNNSKIFESLDCQCRQEWLDILELEMFARGVYSAT